ncbi:MAG: cbb3-type cytochrome oxidase assembly protein CcoS [Bdellovibrionaceae bacterium]|nr:cbb3-type cytochrome oxidase assembly protein CcoS [Pseudobdellovibrionaceae bacterium]
MEIIFLLMFISFLIAATFLGAFFWANRNAQFRNLSLDAYKVLEDEQDQQSEE